jgi:hypothetical protein
MGFSFFLLRIGSISTCSCSGSYPGLPALTCTYVSLLVHIPGEPFCLRLGLCFFAFTIVSEYQYYNCLNYCVQIVIAEVLPNHVTQSPFRPFFDEKHGCLSAGYSGQSQDRGGLYIHRSPRRLPNQLCVAFLPPLEEKQFPAIPRLIPSNIQPGRNNLTPTATKYKTAMSRPSAKLCTECFPSALRVQRVRPATFRARHRSYATERRALNTPRRPHRSPTCVSERMPHQLVSKARGLATVADGSKPLSAPKDGPMREYDERVEEGRLRDDEYQRGRSHTLLCVF